MEQKFARLDEALEWLKVPSKYTWYNKDNDTNEFVEKYMGRLEHLDKATVDPISYRANFNPDGSWPMRKVNLDKGIR